MTCEKSTAYSVDNKEDTVYAFCDADASTGGCTFVQKVLVFRHMPQTGECIIRLPTLELLDRLHKQWGSGWTDE